METVETGHFRIGRKFQESLFGGDVVGRTRGTGSRPSFDEWSRPGHSGSCGRLRFLREFCLKVNTPTTGERSKTPLFRLSS